jgi:hypothetical protein
MLVMLVEGPAAAIVDRYESNSDGVAAYRALERAVEQHGSEMFLPSLKKKISDAVFPNPNEDPAAFLAMFTSLQRDLANRTAYSIENQIAEIKLLLTTPSTEKYGRLLEITYDDVDTFVDKITNHCAPMLRLTFADTLRADAALDFCPALRAYAALTFVRSCAPMLRLLLSGVARLCCA